MKTTLLLFSIALSSSVFSQQQQLSNGNIFAQTNASPQAQINSRNIENYLNSDNVNDNNVGSPVQTNELINDIDIQLQSNKNVTRILSNQQSNDNDSNVNLGVSSSSSSASASRSNKRTFIKKVSKFKRNFYGKMALHKKSRHQVDICFNWR